MDYIFEKSLLECYYSLLSAQQCHFNKKKERKKITDQSLTFFRRCIWIKAHNANIIFERVSNTFAVLLVRTVQDGHLVAHALYIGTCVIGAMILKKAVCLVGKQNSPFVSKLSANHLSIYVIKAIRTSHIPSIFCIEFKNSMIVYTIATVHNPHCKRR